MIIPPKDPLATDQPELHSNRTMQPDDLNNLFEGAGEEEDPLAEMRNNPDYAELIRELEYIAKQARSLFEPAAEAPSDSVWDKIKSKLEDNGEKLDS